MIFVQIRTEVSCQKPSRVPLSSMEQLQNLRNSRNRRSSADLHGKNMGISTSQLLAEAKGFGSDITSAEKRRVIDMWKILHYKCPNDINIQFCAPSRLGTKAVIPGISKSSSQRNEWN